MPDTPSQSAVRGSTGSRRRAATVRRIPLLGRVHGVLTTVIDNIGWASMTAALRAARLPTDWDARLVLCDACRPCASQFPPATADG